MGTQDVLFPMVPSNRIGADALRWLSLGCRIVLERSNWTVKAETLGGLRVDFSTLWDGPVEWLLERGFAAQRNSGTEIVISEMGREFLRDTDFALRELFFQMTPPLGPLKSLIAAVRKTLPHNDHVGVTYIVSLQLLGHHFGQEWLEEYVMGQSGPTDFFRNDWATDHRRNVHILRVIHLAEMLVNMQEKDGFDGILGAIRGGKIESSYAELEVGKLLQLYGVQFRFNRVRGVRGLDYDLEVTVRDQVICADAKCRLETTKESEDRLVGVLHDARDQLPADRPGALFVKLPQTWNEDGAQDRHFDAMERVAEKFFRQTGRVVSVVFFFSLALDFGEHTAPIHLVAEHTNPNHRFGDWGNDWRIIPNRAPVTKPADWIDLITMCA